MIKEVVEITDLSFDGIVNATFVCGRAEHESIHAKPSRESERRRRSIGRRRLLTVALLFKLDANKHKS